MEHLNFYSGLRQLQIIDVKIQLTNSLQAGAQEKDQREVVKQLHEFKKKKCPGPESNRHGI